MEVDKRKLARSYINVVKECAPLFGHDANTILSEVANECPTLDNKINCSECTHECKLRMQPEQSKEDIPPEYPPAVIYY